MELSLGRLPAAPRTPCLRASVVNKESLMAKRKTLGSSMTSVRLCELNAWPVGAVLSAEPLDKSQSRSNYVVQITGFGDERVVVRGWDWADAAWERREILLHLPTRDWRLETELEQRARWAPALVKLARTHGGTDGEGTQAPAAGSAGALQS